MKQLSLSFPVAAFTVIAAVCWSGLVRGQDAFPSGVEGILYYCPRIDLLPPSVGGPLGIEVDGMIDEEAWGRASWALWSTRFPSTQAPQEPDCILEWAAVADLQTLYVAWRIADDVRSNLENHGCDVFNDDSVEFYIDANHDDGELYRIDDVQILLGVDQIDVIDPFSIGLGITRGIRNECLLDGLPAPEVCRARLAGLISTTGWQGEAAIPLETTGVDGFGWPQWNVDPVHRSSIGWNIAVNDDDDGGGRDDKLNWSALDTMDASWTRPSVFGDLMFFDPGRALVEVRRDIPDSLRNGGSDVVTLHVIYKYGRGTVEIVERPPEGLEPSNPSNGGMITEQKEIVWTLDGAQPEYDLTYTVQAKEAVDGDFKLTIDGTEIVVLGDARYTGSPMTPEGFIKDWLHLGPLAGGSCGNEEILLDWIADAGGDVTEKTIRPFPGLITKPRYGGDGIPPPEGTGAKAAGLVIMDEKERILTVTDIQPAWKAGHSSSDTIEHGSAAVHGYNAEHQVTLSCVYVTNNRTTDIVTRIGLDSDDAMQVLLDDQEVYTFTGCRNTGDPGTERDMPDVTLPAGREMRILVKVANDSGDSEFRLRFQDPDDPSRGLLPPDIGVSLVSQDDPPPAIVTRSLPASGIAPGGSVDVALEVTAPFPAGIDVVEVLPPGCSVTNPGGGDQGDGTLTWRVDGATTLRYSLAVPVCTAELQFGRSTWKVGDIEALVLGPSSISTTLAEGAIPGWTSRDLDSPVESGSAMLIGDDEILAAGSGSDVLGTADAHRFISVPESGDFDISARIDCMDDPGGSGIGGLLVRASEDPSSPEVFFGLRPGGAGAALLRLVIRKAGGATAGEIALPQDEVPALPLYLKVARRGTTLTLQTSSDGSTYGVTRKIGIGSDWEVDLPDDVQVGLAVTGSGGGSARVAFGSVKVEPVGVAEFRRGDADGSGKLDITDAISTLRFLYMGDAAPACKDAADTDDSGVLDLTDAISSLQFQFMGGPAPASPGPATCGPDPTEGDPFTACPYTKC
jgi:hypothetical protein